MKGRILLVFVLAVFILSACGSISGPRTGGMAFAVTPAASKSAIVGTVISTAGSGEQILSNTIVRLAKVFWNEDKTDGEFILEGARSPSTISLEDGSFAFTDLEPGDYVVVVGDVTADHVIYADSDAKAIIFTAEADKVTNTGEIKVPLRAPEQQP